MYGVDTILIHFAVVFSRYLLRVAKHALRHRFNAVSVDDIRELLLVARLQISLPWKGFPYFQDGRLCWQQDPFPTERFGELSHVMKAKYGDLRLSLSRNSRADRATPAVRR